MAEAASKIPAANASGGAGTTPVAPVAGGSAPNQAGTLAAPAGAKESIAQSGGNPTGQKPRGRFKHPAHTPAGKEERRQHDNKRVADKRAAEARRREPPTLLPPAQSVSDQVAPSGADVSAGAAGQAPDPFVPWTENDVAPFTNPMVELSEARRIDKFVELAREAGLSRELCKQIEKDAHYPVDSKVGLQKAVALTTAKWLNKSGISAKNKEEASILFLGGTIWLHGSRMYRRLESLIEDHKSAGRAGGPDQPYTLSPAGSTPAPATKP